MKKTKNQLAAEAMTGQTQNWTRADVDTLYPGMPQVAAGIWENIERARKANAEEQEEMESPLFDHYRAI